ncbi:hypothetical protein RD792_006940 [Penstemon davidsonii]|uniref:Pentatricopeptide repeat-containing protein n=1 Tax=Penstemon davidsonii TaxID=160366 RepID=A0ABR0D6D2_9LAMI|nr:hypothetical protein RD792_006940 [Penstemon davidsonii]
MPSSTAGNLVSLFRSAAKLTLKCSFSTAAAASKKNKPPSPSSSAITKEKNKKIISPSSSNADDEALKKYVTSINYSESAKRLLKSYKAPPSSNSSLNSIVKDSLNPGYSCRIADGDESAELLSTLASNISYNKFDLDWDHENEDEEPVGENLDLLRFSTLNNQISSLRKEFTRERKHKWVFTNTQTTRFDKLSNNCANKLGPDRMIEIFGKLGKETGLKEYSSLIKICIEKARVATDEDASLEEIYKAFQLFKIVKENGFKIEEEIYGQFLLYLIDCGLVEDFFFFCELFRDENPDSLPQLTYYEMLLWVRVNNEVKIQELCHSAMADGAEEKSYLREQLLLALCESDRKEEFVMLLETLDVTKVTSVAYLLRVFSSLGKLLLEPFAERFLLALETSG